MLAIAAPSKLTPDQFFQQIPAINYRQLSQQRSFAALLNKRDQNRSSQPSINWTGMARYQSGRNFVIIFSCKNGRKSFLPSAFHPISSSAETKETANNRRIIGVSSAVWTMRCSWQKTTTESNLINKNVYFKIFPLFNGYDKQNLFALNDCDVFL